MLPRILHENLYPLRGIDESTLPLGNRVRRRRLIAAVGSGAVGWPLAARTQQSGMARVGWLTIARNPQIDSFRAGMRDLGYVEGRNLTIEQRDADGNPELLAPLATDLARQKVNVLVAIGGIAARAAREDRCSPPRVTSSG